MNSIHLLAFSFLMLGTPIDESAPATYQPAPCPFAGAAEIEGLECGVLIVPEQREKTDGRTLELAVAVLRSSSSDPAPDPVVFLSGGPGGSSVEFVPGRARSAFWNRIRQKRDLVFFDQRGTGYSEPEFCSEMEAVFNAVIYRGLSEDQRLAELVSAAAACREKMHEQDVDLTAYNSAASAQDVADLRRALGYESWNLFGLSYGTRLALTALRDAPDGIRSVILDSVSPPNVAGWSDAGERFTRSLQLAFAQCADSADCRETFPSLEADFYNVVADLDSDPVVISMPESSRFPDGRLVVDGSLWLTGMFQGFYDRSFLPVFPLIVRESSRRNKDVLRALAERLARDPERNSVGMKYAVDCYEKLPFNTPEKIGEDRRRYSRLAPWFDIGGGSERAVCEVWHDARAGGIEFQPVHSTTPALILAGEFDPITPPAYGRKAAQTLPNSTFVEVPAMGHAVSPFTPCTRDLINEFLDAPDQPLDVSCVADLPTVSFVTDVHMNGGVFRFTSALRGDVGALALPAFLAVVFLLAAVGWPIAFVARRLRGRNTATASAPGQAVARPLAGLAAVSALIFFAGLVFTIMQTAAMNPYVLAFGVPGHAAWLFMLPWVVMLLTVGTVVLAIQSWRQGWWTRAARVRYTIVAGACVGFVAFVATWGLM